MRWPHFGRAPNGMGHPKAITLGQLALLRPSKPLWPRAAVRPDGIGKFSIFLWIYSNRIQIKFGLKLNLFKIV
jgi:hypothetical protein